MSEKLYTINYRIYVTECIICVKNSFEYIYKLDTAFTKFSSRNIVRHLNKYPQGGILVFWACNFKVNFKYNSI